MESQIAKNDFRILHIEPRHTSLLTNLPPHHKAPFDRLLLAQAIVEEMPIVSADPQLDAHPVTHVW